MSNAHVDSLYPLSALTSKIIAAAQEVHRFLGPGFEEVIYQRVGQGAPGPRFGIRARGVDRRYLQGRECGAEACRFYRWR